MDPLFAFTIALALAALLAGSALHQVATFHEWRTILGNYALVPTASTAALSVLIPAAELATAAALLAPRMRPGGCVAAAALLGLFAAAIWINIRRGRTRIDCGCFGSRRGQGLALWMVWRNLLLLMVALLLFIPARSRPLGAFDVAAGIGCVVALAFLYPAVAVVLRPVRIRGQARTPRGWLAGAAVPWRPES